MTDSRTTGAEFTEWSKMMQRNGHYKTDRECAEALGVGKNTFVTMKKNGCDRRTALACTALQHGLKPFKMV